MMQKEDTQEVVQKFKNTMANKHGIIICSGPDGEYLEARTCREVEEKTGIHHNTVQYALTHSGRTRKGWKLWREQS